MNPHVHRHEIKEVNHHGDPSYIHSLSFRLYPSGFTLIEIVLVLSLVAILAAAAVPAVNGLRDDATARKPMTSLAKLAKETRLRAMRDKRPYQIAFTSRGFTATRYLSPYLQAAELEQFLQTPAPPPAAEPPPPQALPTPAPTASTDPGSAPATASTPFVNWTETQALPEGMQYRVQFWHEAAPTEISGESVKLWVFQPTGIVVPLTVTLTYLGNTYSATFNAMTGDIDRLRQL